MPDNWQDLQDALEAARLGINELQKTSKTEAPALIRLRSGNCALRCKRLIAILQSRSDHPRTDITLKETN